ncbi:GM13735 [Drosophila sechellia]|uniref:GM13735 n=1 Tax=Drosophila sechellia TaxID=7238 RepID=B4IPN3_DROSE|nr:GM13735 [Drosophila sechellia]
MQDSFQVWIESKKDIRLRMKPKRRHIFLYQKSLLLCKQTSKSGYNKSSYQFKSDVKVSHIMQVNMLYFYTFAVKAKHHISFICMSLESVL